MPSHTFDSSNAADRAAKKAGRFFKGKVYNTKAQAEAARKAAASVGQTSGGGQGATKKKDESGRVSMVVEVARTVDVRSAAGSWAIAVCGDNNPVAELAALKARKPVVKGVRVEVRFPLTAAKVRWAVAGPHQLSAGHKTVEQVSKVRGASVFSDGDFVSRWVTVAGVAGACYKEDDNNNTLFTPDDARHAIFAAQSSDDVDGVTFTWHITVMVDAVGATTVVDL